MEIGYIEYWNVKKKFLKVKKPQNFISLQLNNCKYINHKLAM